MASERGLGKCAHAHIGSYGYTSRPEQQYPFCPQCGTPMVWRCHACDAAMPDDADELAVARFCRHCGAAYFGDEPGKVDDGGSGVTPKETRERAG